MSTTLVLSIAVFCLGVDTYVVVALLPAVAESLAEPITSLGLLVSAYALPSALLAPVFGPLSDRIGRRLAMLIGMAIFLVAVSGSAIAPTFGILVLTRAVNGLGAAIVLPAVFAYAGDLPTLTQRSQAMGTLAVAFPLASILGLPVGAFLAGMVSWRATFAAVALLALVVIVLLWRLQPDRPKAGTAISYREGYRLVLGDRRTLGVLAVTFVWFLGPMGMFPFLAAFFVGEFGLATSQVGLVFLVIGVVGVASAKLGSRFIATVGPRRAVLIGITAFGVAVFVLPSAPGLALALPVLAVWVFGTWFGLPAQQTLAAGLIPRARGTVLAFNSSAFNLAGVVSPILAGAILGAGTIAGMNGFRLLGTWSALLALGALALAFVLLPREERAPTAGEAPEALVVQPECAPVA
jgi:multidrug resistance protein